MSPRRGRPGVWLALGSVAVLLAVETTGARAERSGSPVSASAPAAAQGRRAASAVLVRVRGKVLAVDRATGTLTLRDQAGKLRELVASDLATLAAVEVGDRVDVEVYTSVAADLERLDEGDVELSEKVSERPADGGRSAAGGHVRRLDVVARVTAIDLGRGTLTLEGPRGNAVDLGGERGVLEGLQVGDLVSATYTEALAIGITQVAEH